MKAINVDDVLKILHKYGKYIFVTDEKRYSSMVDEIANLKALAQEPKTGHWTDDGYCSCCNQQTLPLDESGYMSYYHSFCPNCGADMREVEE